MKRISILQPGYLPWLGFFQQMERCDVFVLLDDVQFTKNDWRNRNRIKTATGVQWLTVPVLHKFGQTIKDTLIDNKSRWAKKHIQSLKTSYGKSTYFGSYFEEIEKYYQREWKYLIDIDRELTAWFFNALKLKRELHVSSELNLASDDRQLRLIEICETLGCDVFYEGKSGRNYMDVQLFREKGIDVEFQDYAHPFYTQLWTGKQGFISHLSIIDLLFNEGPDSLDILSGKKIVPRPEGILLKSADEFK